jgi:hypothetical protein
MAVTPARSDLARFIGDPRTLRAFEELFAAVSAHLLGALPTQSKAAGYTVLAEESGTVFIATAADVEFTLPATAIGLTYTFVFKVPSAGVGGQVSPAAADKIMGNGFTSADNKAAINSGATDREGDSITVVGDGSAGWFIVGLTGTWAREA